MGMIFLITGIFAGIGLFLATMYSVSQIILLEGRGQLAHGVLLALILFMMACLMERWLDTARLTAVAIMPTAFWVMVLEPRWYRVFPIVVMGFAGLVISGVVTMG